MTATISRPTASVPAAGPARGALDVLVIGAGPYGLSAGAFLRHAGLRVRILGQTMHSWKAHMPKGMYLKSAPAASSLATPRPGHGLTDYCAAIGVAPLTDAEPVPIELFTDYGSWFADRLVPDVEPVLVRRVERHGGRFVVTTGEGERILTGAVVVASGLIGHAYVPPSLSALAERGERSSQHTDMSAFDGREIDGRETNGRAIDGRELADIAVRPWARPLSHTSEHADMSVFAGREVAVVGAGQSALESAALLAESGARPVVVARRPRVLFADAPDPDLGDIGRVVDRRHLLPKPDSPLGPGLSLFACAHGAAAIRHLPLRARLELVARILGPSGAWWLRDRIEGVVPILENHRVVGGAVNGDRIALRVAGPGGPGHTLHVDHLLAATGYRVGPEAFGFLAPDLRARLECRAGWPGLGADFGSSIPGLYFIGFPAAGAFGPLMRFVCGTAFAAPRVAAAVAARAAHRS